MAEISGGEYRLPWTSTVATSLPPDTILYGTRLVSSLTSPILRPMNRLMENTVFCGFVTAWRLAIWPTRRSPSFVNPTTDGVVRPPSELGMTTGSPPSITETTEFVVPRSMPITLSAIASSHGKERSKPSRTASGDPFVARCWAARSGPDLRVSLAGLRQGFDAMIRVDASEAPLRVSSELRPRTNG